jgi:hypothetical protein
MADPVSWLQIEQGWNVVAADGILVGTVAQVEGDKHDDIFDGLAVASQSAAQVVYVPGEEVGMIYPGEVNLKIASTATFEPFRATPLQKTFRPGKLPVTARISTWLRGRR